MQSSSGCTQTPISTKSSGRPADRAPAQRRRQRQQVDAEQQAQHDAEVAEVRQPAAGGVLLYNRHPIERLDFRPFYEDQFPFIMSQNNASQYTWAGRFSEPMSDLVKRYTASVDFDQRMWRQDIRGSLAHAKMLARQGIIAAQDLADIERGMKQVWEEIEAGKLEWQLDLEDVNLNIEKRLTALVGDAGKRLHTGRSRNDQVATDIRLWLRDTIDDILVLIRQFQEKTCWCWPREAATPMPGSTHLQVAQPVTFGHHLLAYFEMTQRDGSASPTAASASAACRSGAAALAGTTYPIDREFVAKELGFDGVCENSLDAVSDRDFGIEFCAAAALLMTHFSRLGRAGAVDEPALRLREDRRPFLHRQLDHAAEEEPGRPGTGARQDRPRERRLISDADADEGPAAGLQQGQPGRQGTAVRHRRHGARHAAHLRRHDGRHRPRARTTCATR